MTGFEFDMMNISECLLLTIMLLVALGIATQATLDYGMVGLGIVVAVYALILGGILLTGFLLTTLNKRIGKRKSSNPDEDDG